MGTTTSTWTSRGGGLKFPLHRAAGSPSDDDRHHSVVDDPAADDGTEGRPRRCRCPGTYDPDAAREFVIGHGMAVRAAPLNDTAIRSDINKWYFSTFAGTSGGSPFVAAAVANIQGIAMKIFGFPLEPKEVRKLLTDTGLPQEDSDNDGEIGPLVNLRNAIDKLSDGNITAKPTAAPTKAKPTGTKAATRTAKPSATPSTDKPTATPTTSTKAGKCQLF